MALDILMGDHLSISIALAYAVFFAKEHAGGCGKQSQLVLLPGWLPPVNALSQTLDELETVFRRYGDYLNQIRRNVLSIPPIQGFSGVDGHLSSFRDAVKDCGKRLYPNTPFTPFPEAAK
jgi:hypothetical protein